MSKWGSEWMTEEAKEWESYFWKRHINDGFLTFLVYQYKNHPNIIFLLDAKAKPLATSTEAACFTFCLRILLIYNKMTNYDCDSSIFFKVLLKLSWMGMYVAFVAETKSLLYLTLE